MKNFEGWGRKVHQVAFKYEDTEKRLSNKEAATKYNVQKNTISKWVKNKDKILSSLEKGQNVKRQRPPVAAHEALDQAVFEWFLNICSQNVSLSGTIIQEKTSSYAKNLNIKISRLKMVGYIVGKSKEISFSKKFLENQILQHQ